MTPTAPRFYAQDGKLYADRREVSLEWAQERVFAWWGEARRQAKLGDRRLSEEVRRQADALQIAKHRAEDQLRLQEAERWVRNPVVEAYERRMTREEVGYRLSESVEK